MKNWTITRRLTTGFAIVIALNIVIGIIALVNVSAIRGTTSSMAETTYPQTVALYQIESEMSQNFGRVESYLVAPEAGRPKIAGDVVAAGKEIDNAFNAYAATLSAQDETAAFNSLKAHRDEFDQAFSEIVQLSTTGHNDEAIAKANTVLAPAFSAIVDDDLSHLTKLNQAKADDTNTSIGNSVNRGTSAAVIEIIFNILAVAVVAWLLIRAITHALTRLATGMSEGANQVSFAASQVSAGSQTLAEGASEQAASLEETSSSLEEMASMTKRNSENAHLANDIAKQTRIAADKGAADMATMSSAMEAIKASSDDIAKIIKTIDEIAFQTNILALNAAVEAARAGEAGMGFAVVADEVRNLAQRSAQAAKETAAKIEGAITKSGQGVEISSKVAKTLNEIVAKVRRMDELVAEVAGASREQTEGIAQINSAVGQMDKVTQSNSANAEESAAAAEELNAQAETMKESINELLSLVGAGTAVPTGRTPAVLNPSRHRPLLPGSRRAVVVKSTNGTNGHAEANGHAAANGHAGPNGHGAASAANGSNGANGHHAASETHGTNGHSDPVTTRSVPSRLANRREIPMDGDFKDF